MKKWKKNTRSREHFYVANLDQRTKLFSLIVAKFMFNPVKRNAYRLLERYIVQSSTDGVDGAAAQEHVKWQ